MYQMTESDRRKVRAVEAQLKELEQIKCETWHTLHGGLYTRTLKLAAGTTTAGAEIIIPTTLFVTGNVLLYSGGDVIEIDGTKVITASAGRKQIWHAIEDTTLVMSFATNATTIEEAELEFTNEADNLMSRLETSINHINITGE